MNRESKQLYFPPPSIQGSIVQGLSEPENVVLESGSCNYFSSQHTSRQFAHTQKVLAPTIPCGKRFHSFTVCYIWKDLLLFWTWHLLISSDVIQFCIRTNIPSVPILSVLYKVWGVYKPLCIFYKTLPCIPLGASCRPGSLSEVFLEDSHYIL